MYDIPIREDNRQERSFQFSVSVSVSAIDMKLFKQKKNVVPVSSKLKLFNKFEPTLNKLKLISFNDRLNR